MVLVNPGYETDGAAAGYPDGWTVRSKTSLWEVVGWSSENDTTFRVTAQPNDLGNLTEWVTTNLTAVSNDAVAPDGTTTAAKLTDNAVNANHLVKMVDDRLFEAETVYTLGFFVKWEDQAYVGPYIDFGGGAELWAVFDASIGNTEATNLPTGVDKLAVEVNVLNDGWAVVALTFLVGDSPLFGKPGIAFFNSNLGTLSYAGTGTKNLWVWNYFTLKGTLDDFEGFERRWDNDSYIYELTPGDTSLGAVWDDGTVQPADAEGFEGAWGNHPYYTNLEAVGEAATFDETLTPAEAVEDFEEDWDNDDYLTELTEPTTMERAIFYAGFDDDSAETFEKQWSDNQDYEYEISGVTRLLWDNQLGNSAETFENAIEDLEYVVNSSTNVFTVSSNPYNDNATVRVVNIGGAYPGGVIHTLKYYIINSTPTTFKLSLTSGGTSIDVTDEGSGTNIIRAHPDESWSGPDFNPTM